jgi:hypothetical protein
MRDLLHVCSGGTVLRAAIAAAVLAVSTPALAQGKVIRPEAAAGIANPDVAERSKPAAEPPVATARAKPEAKGKTAADPNAPEPLSERAQAALDRAKSALEAEDAEDFVPEPTPLPTPLAKPIAVGQPVKTPDKSATATTKPAVKCLAGC